MKKNKTKPKAKRIHADEALPVWALDSGHDGLLEIYAVNGRFELRRDGWLLDDDEDTVWMAGVAAWAEEMPNAAPPSFVRQGSGHALPLLDAADDAVLRDLAQRGVNELHVEAGHKLNGSLIREGCIDEFLIYLAPTLLGLGQGMAQWGPLEELSQGIPLTFTETQLIGKDLRILARVQP